VPKQPLAYEVGIPKLLEQTNPQLGGERHCVYRAYDYPPALLTKILSWTWVVEPSDTLSGDAKNIREQKSLCVVHEMPNQVFQANPWTIGGIENLEKSRAFGQQALDQCRDF